MEVFNFIWLFNDFYFLIGFYYNLWFIFFMFLEYFYVFVFFIFCLVFVIVLFFLPFFLFYHKPDSEKLSSYECGFDPFYYEARFPFNIQYYIIAILFIIFDLEISFLFPVSIILTKINFLGLFIFFFFVFVLILGFFYEFFKGVLNAD
jgi:NADH:ubiquinone oxidoreductase subunit 3 (subunit A)